ncbi:MAG: hypothetical protein Q8S53_15395 [Brevundimonas sp.]|uniref:hypothetical protein n=1 Tax=Brevundimonas sp. TaxID=1871086 RepID=UPI0027365388|nr:hypothetical protein [Brevundimonas sp.]MDP3379749.1 hypothetical protein [Brevundimonas sp.]
MSADFDELFQALRPLLLAHADGLLVTRDAPGDLVVRTPAVDAKGEPGWFGTVTVKKSYVAVHLLPLYDHPALAEDLSLGLTRRRQGKTCFNFKRVEPELFEELSELMARVRRVVDAA